MATVDVPDEFLSLLCDGERARGLDVPANEVVVSLVERAAYRTGKGRYARDQLTRCKSKARFRRELTEAMGGTGRTERSLYEERFLCADMDNFKAYLDVHGLQAGDEVLRKVGSLLQAHFGESDVYRFGGDEFVVVLHDRDAWVPNSPPQACIKYSVVDVSVRRDERHRIHLCSWIEHHLSGAMLCARVTGNVVECRTPAWMNCGV